MFLLLQPFSVLRIPHQKYDDDDVYRGNNQERMRVVLLEEGQEYQAFGRLRR